MKYLIIPALISIASLSCALSAPVGICLHANSPEAPPEKVECFQYSKFEVVSGGYRFFIEPSGTTIITKYRYRGNIAYEDNLLPGTPDFSKKLKFYEAAATKYPSTRTYLNPKIVSMRSQAERISAVKQALAALPKLTISGNDYTSPKYRSIEKGKLVFTHNGGIAKIDIDSITDAEIQSLIKIDPGAGQINVVEISGNRIWNPIFESLAGNRINIKHGKGLLSLEFEQATKKDKELIMSWSDGSWKIEKPGYYLPNDENLTYGEIVLESGRFYNDVNLKERNGDSVILKTKKSSLEIHIRELASMPGITSEDSMRIDNWATEIISERQDRATPVESTKVLSFDEAEVLRVTDVRVLILQVLDEGVLASKFVGKLHKGTQTVKTTKTVTVEHPVTGEKIIKILDESTDEIEIVEDVNDDLCYIVGNTSNLVDGEIVKADSMKLVGRFQYTSVAGAERSVRKYHVD